MTCLTYRKTIAGVAFLGLSSAGAVAFAQSPDAEGEVRMRLEVVEDVRPALVARYSTERIPDPMAWKAGLTAGSERPPVHPVVSVGQDNFSACTLD